MLLLVPQVYSYVDRVDMDYFNLADEQAKGLLHLVEKYHLNKGVYYELAKGDYKFIINEAKFILRYFPNHPRGLTLLGLASIKTHKYRLPISFYKKALRLYPQYAVTHAQYGVYLLKTGNIDQGISKLKKAIEINPKLDKAYVWLANAYYTKGNIELSRKTAKKARKLGYRGKIIGEDKKGVK